MATPTAHQHGTQHEDFTMGKIHNVQDAINQRQTQRRQNVQSPIDQANGQTLQ